MLLASITGNLLFAGGLALVLVATYDSLKTTVSFSGGGPVTLPLAKGVWGIALAIHRAWGNDSGKLLKPAGPVILLLTVFIWILMVFTGYAMMFGSDDYAVINSSTRLPADFIEKTYFTAYTLFTVGMGDFLPNGHGWQLATSIASLHGLFLVTLSITYLLPVVSAVVEKHSLAGFIGSLGGSPEEIVTRAWDGSGFTSLNTPLIQISHRLETHTQRHLAYPVLHFFQSDDRRTAFALNVAALNEALTIMNEGVVEEARLPATVGRSAARAVEGFLALMESTGRYELIEAPAGTDPEALRAEGIPIISGGFPPDVSNRLERQRALFHAVMADSGRDWSDLIRPKGTGE